MVMVYGAGFVPAQQVRPKSAWRPLGPVDIVATVLSWLAFAGLAVIEAVFVVALGLTAEPCQTTDAACMQELHEFDGFVLGLGVLYVVTLLLVVIGQVWFGIRRRHVFWWPLLGMVVVLVGQQFL